MRQTLAFFMAGLVLTGLFLSSVYNYLLFHSLAEIFSVVIACGIFVVAWNSRQFLKNDYLMLLGVAYLFVAGLDLMHTLAYSGMPIFPGYGANLATQLWIAARWMESLSLVLAPLLLHRHIKAELLFGVYAGLTLLVLLSIFAWKVFPDCFVEGTGLTVFKRVSEYGICLVLLGAIVLLLRNRQAFDAQVLKWLVWSLVLTIGSELAFTFYVNVYGLSNLVGHYFKIVSFYLVYKAIIETGLAKPYALLLRESKQAENELQKAKEELAATNASLEQLVQERTAKLQETVGELEHFSYAITHDMRAPLRAMQGFAGILEEQCGERLDAENRTHLQRIKTSANRMDRLIIDALSYSKAVKQELALSPVDVAALLRGMIESYPDFQPPKADIQIEGNIPLVVGNEAGLTQCFSNLLDNAVKFVEPGKVPRVRIRAEQREDLVRLWVEDNGIGIPKHAQTRVFDMFQRLSKDHEGTGIGLAVVRKVSQRMGGTVGVESEPGKGSRFWVEFKGVEPVAVNS